VSCDCLGAGVLEPLLLLLAALVPARFAGAREEVAAVAAALAPALAPVPRDFFCGITSSTSDSSDSDLSSNYSKSLDQPRTKLRTFGVDVDSWSTRNKRAH
jgi:hypothetical protein